MKVSDFPSEFVIDQVQTTLDDMSKYVQENGNGWTVFKVGAMRVYADAVAALMPPSTRELYDDLLENSEVVSMALLEDDDAEE